MAAILRHSNWQKPQDIAELFQSLGIGQFNVPLAIQYAFFLPRTSDPYAQGIILIIRGLQRTLNRRGAGLVVDGGLGPKTAAVIERVSGPDWQNKTWIQLASDAIAARVTPQEVPVPPIYLQPTRAASESLSGTFLGDVFESPIPLIALGALGVWWWKNR